MDQIERIKKMEALMDKVSAAVKDINKGLDDFNAVMEDVDTLEEYYSGEDWMKDFEADEAGKLPKDLKRGVLSEDGLFDLLDEERLVFVRMMEMCAAYMKNA
ncbi:MAG: DUF4298 domain-containing protein [Firmicutes bacterium]|nr:DUF4298 domain-containing protein [Bacillota bacterium]